MQGPWFWLVAGPNGAGKSTLSAHRSFARALQGVDLAHPDDSALELLRQEGFRGFADAPADAQRRCFIAAAQRTEEELLAALAEGRTVGAETVLSTSKYLRHVEATRHAGGCFGLVYIALSSPALSARRVARRVQRGGHDVPGDRLERRWRASLANLPAFARLAATFMVFDNSNEEPSQPPLLVCEGADGRVQRWHGAAFPELAEALAAVT